ncbi:MAG: AraC family transcriptional regulator [Pseudomonadota bacterium]
MTGGSAMDLISFYEQSAYAAFPQEHRSGGIWPLDMLRVDQEPHALADPAMGEFVLQLVLDADMSFRWDVEGRYWSKQQHSQTGAFCIAPPDTHIQYECTDRHELLLLALPTDYLNTVLGEVGATPAPLEALVGPLFQDAAMRRTMLELWKSAQTPGPMARLGTEGHVHLLLEHLLRLASGPSLTSDGPHLNDREMDRIDDRLRDPAQSKVTIEELAALLDWPQLDLRQAFKVKTGRTLHQYVLDLRVEQARDMLTRTNMSLAEIAYACGFSSQQHMTNAFSSRLGTPPGRFRKTNSKGDQGV